MTMIELTFMVGVELYLSKTVHVYVNPVIAQNVTLSQFLQVSNFSETNSF